MGPFKPSRRGSELAKLCGEPISGSLPEVDVTALREAHRAVRDGVRTGLLHSAHDIAEGGLAVALAECCAARRDRGAGLAPRGGRTRSLRRPAGASSSPGPQEALGAFEIIGRVGGAELEITGHLKVAVSALHDSRELGLAGLA